MSERKRKAAAGPGIRKRRMLNLEVHELPDSLFKPPDESSLRSTGVAKQFRRNQGGARRKRSTSQKGRAPNTAAEKSVSTIAEAGLEGEICPLGESWASAQTGGSDVDHVSHPTDHEAAFVLHPLATGSETELGSGTDDDGSDSDTEDDDYDLEVYAEAVNTHVAGFHPVCANIFVVQGWNSSNNQTTNSWFHLKFQSLVSADLSIACTCPRAAYNDCIHIRYFDQYRVEEKAIGDRDSIAVVFSQRIIPGVGLHSLFSVQSSSVVELRGRAIVSHQGSGRDNGKWKCSKDNGTEACYHIKHARDLLPESFGEAVAEAMKFGGDGAVIKGTSVGIEPRGPGQTVSYLPIRPPHWAVLPTDPPLYEPQPDLRIPSPDTTFKLDSDSTCADGSRSRFDPRRQIITKKCKYYTILNVYSVDIEVQSCPNCPTERKRFIGPDLRTFGVFNYNNSVLVSHELLDEYTSAYTSSETPAVSYVKTVARRYKKDGSRFMGADLFRSVWFAYAHLQKLTDDMSCSSCGPFPKTVVFDGITLGYGRKFVQDSLQPPTMVSSHSLVRANLDYTRQQQLLPDALLRRRLRAALEGPDFAPLMEDLEGKLAKLSMSPLKSRDTATDLTSTSTQRQSSSLDDPLSTPAIARSFAHYTMLATQSPATPLPSSQLSSTFGEEPLTPMSQPQFIVSGHPKPSTLSISKDNTAPLDDNPFAPQTTTVATPSVAKAVSTSKPAAQGKRVLTDEEWKARQRQLVRDHLSLIEWVHGELIKQGGAECPELASLFNRYFGQLAYAAKGTHSKRALKAWKNLFIQACISQIAAEESVLQFVNFKSWEMLCEYLEDPTAQNRMKLVSIPAIHKVLFCDDCNVLELNSVMRWVEKKARTVLSTLISKASPPLALADPATLPKDDEWRKTGCYYSMPVIRHRPVYPKLDDTEKKSVKDGPRGDRCGKYYSEYKEKRLTGGIMVCWCQHSVCYGFHTIPESEGRNDVFSALVTRWPLAPERIVYDFACALGPYCMTREPQFFGNTYFAIDHFHAAGHTKCSPAAFLSEYENTDPRLSAVNSSAAECGNGALRRIRKSVSYMSQERAIIYTKVFLSIWNRTRALAKGEKARKTGKAKGEKVRKGKEKKRGVASG